MVPFYREDDITIYRGDCLGVMGQMADNSVSTILTDPPYGYEFMGKGWDYGVPGVPYWREALRVAKPGTPLLAFGGTRTHHRLMTAIEDAGWLIRDCTNYFHDGSAQAAAFLSSLSPEQLVAYLELHYPNDTMAWVHGGSIPKGIDISKGIDKMKGAEREVVGPLVAPAGNKGKTVALGGSWQVEPSITAPATSEAAEWDGWKSKIKPAWEPIIVAMKPMDGTFAENALKWGVAGLWVDGCMVEATDKRKFPDGVISDTENVYGNGKGYHGTSPRGSDKHPFGRYPANVIHDGSKEVLAEFAKAKGLGRSAYPGNERRAKEQEGKIYEKTGDLMFESLCNQSSRNFSDTGSAARFFYCAKASRSERGPNNTHCTVKPLALLRYLARLTKTPSGGVILDPFMGSGTTLLAARSEGRAAIGIELEREYCDIAVERLGGEVVEEPEVEEGKVPRPGQLRLF